RPPLKRLFWAAQSEMSISYLLARLELVEHALRLLIVGIDLHRFLEILDRVLFVVLPVVRLSHRGVGRRRGGIELGVHRQERERIVGLVPVGERVGERDEAGVAEVVALAAVVLLAQRLVLIDRRSGAALRRRLG